MALIDSLQQSLGGMAQQQPAAAGMQGGQTASIQKLAQAASGKAGASSQPRADDTQERMALQQGRAASQVLENEKNMAARAAQQAQSEQQQEFEIAGQQLDEKQVNAKQKMQQDAQQIINSIVSSGKQLDFDKDKARMEQLGFNLRLSNEQYIDKLKAEGSRNRLDNDVAFDEALQNSIWADEVGLLKSDLSFKTALNGDKRRWDEELSEMSLEQAMAVAAIDSASRANSQYWSGMSTAVSAGAQAGAAGYAAYTAPSAKVETQAPAAQTASASSVSQQEPSLYQQGKQISGPRSI